MMKVDVSLYTFLNKDGVKVARKLRNVKLFKMPEGTLAYFEAMLTYKYRPIVGVNVQAYSTIESS